MLKTISSREFNHDVGGAKRAAHDGPVIITDRGRPAHVLLSIEEYRRLTGHGKSISELMYWPGAAEIEIEFERSKDVGREIDLE